MNLVVFDVDGTLILSTGVDDECFARAIEAAWRISNISTQWDDYEHVTDTGIASELFQKHFGRNPARAEIEALQQEFVNQLASVLSDTSIPQTAGVSAVLLQLEQEQRWRAAIATGSWARAIDFKLQAAGLALGSLPMATSDDAFDRAEIIEVAVDRAKERYGQPSWGSIVYVGDGLWDLRAANNLGCGFVGIASGDKAERLLNEGAKHVLPDLSEITRFSDVIAAASSNAQA
jgi:phosphoglycolate phosphatase-like HAD superfamily hydrolase